MGNLKFTFLYEVLQVPPLFIRDDQLGPLVWLEPHALQGVVLDELDPKMYKFYYKLHKMLRHFERCISIIVSVSISINSSL